VVRREQAEVSRKRGEELVVTGCEVECGGRMPFCRVTRRGFGFFGWGDWCKSAVSRSTSRLLARRWSEEKRRTQQKKTRKGSKGSIREAEKKESSSRRMDSQASSGRRSRAFMSLSLTAGVVVGSQLRVVPWRGVAARLGQPGPSWSGNIGRGKANWAGG